MDNKTLYKPFKYTGKGVFKYSVYVKDKNGNKKLIHYGNRNYQHFKDKIGAYSHLDHGDPKRRKSYLARSGGIRNKEGKLTKDDKNSKNFWARKTLW